MNNTQLNKLNHVYKTKSVNNGFEYYYDIQIRHDIFLGKYYRPILVEKGILIDYFKPLKKLLKDEKNITEDAAYKIVFYHDTNDAKHISLCSITPEKAQKLIDRNIALFTQFNTKLQEKQLLDAINKI